MSGKLIECQKPVIGKLIHRLGGKQIQCQVVNFFIDIRTIGALCNHEEPLQTLELINNWNKKRLEKKQTSFEVETKRKRRMFYSD